MTNIMGHNPDKDVNQTFYEFFLKNLDKKWNTEKLFSNPNISWNDIKDFYLRHPDLFDKYKGAISKNPSVTIDDFDEACLLKIPITWNFYKDSVLDYPSIILNNKFRPANGHPHGVKYRIKVLCQNPGITWDNIEEFAENLNDVNYNTIRSISREFEVGDSFPLAHAPKITWENIQYALDNYPQLEFGPEIWSNPNIKWEDIEMGVKKYRHLFYEPCIMMSPAIDFDLLIKLLGKDNYLKLPSAYALGQNPNFSWTNIKELIDMGYDNMNLSDFVNMSKNLTFEDIQDIITGNLPIKLDFKKLSMNPRIDWTTVYKYPEYEWDYGELSSNWFGWSRYQTIIKPAGNR